MSVTVAEFTDVTGCRLAIVTCVPASDRRGNDLKNVTDPRGNDLTVSAEARNWSGLSYACLVR